ncbi:MAG: magnesium and cobalt transport protein CorA [Deltaproteobacteria bacterium]|nr:MAG: magnesium and cobalt transport protein CorA [Deltaproteobacteria bacterium]
MSRKASSRRRRRDRAPARAAARRGLPPGAGDYVGPPRDHRIRISIHEYSADHVAESTDASLAAVERARDRPSVTWVDLDGIHDASTVQAIGAAFGLHPLEIEDVLNPSCRPKAEDHGDHVFTIMKMLTPTADDRAYEVEQVSVALGPAWVITFQERPGDPFDAVRQRIRDGKGRIRRHGADYLFHAILDAIVDGWFVILEQTEGSVSDLEAEATGDSPEDLPRRVHARLADILILRRLLWPTREAISALLRTEGRVIHPATKPYLRDLADHVVETLEILDNQRERLTAVLELHLARTSHRLNEVMRLLTVVATLFIPVTFIAGVYGMNFDYMPELHHRHGYPITLLVMATIMLAMVAWLRHRRWI